MPLSKEDYDFIEEAKIFRENNERKTKNAHDMKKVFKKVKEHNEKLLNSKIN
jgi:hypothetical protein